MISFEYQFDKEVRTATDIDQLIWEMDELEKELTEDGVTDYKKAYQGIRAALVKMK